LEITEYYSPAEIELYSQQHEKIPDYILHIDTGYFPVQVKIKKINREKNRITFRVTDEDATRLQDAINSDMSRRHENVHSRRYGKP